MLTNFDAIADKYNYNSSTIIRVLLKGYYNYDVMA